MNAGGPVVSNSSPLIALDRIGQLELLRSLVGEIAVPPAVGREVFADASPPSWIRVVTASSTSDEITSPTLGRGEREAIALAAELGARWLILDDLPARRVAASLGLPVIGTVGLLLAAKRAALLSAVAPVLEQLTAAGFRLSASVLQSTLTAAGES